MKVTRDSEWHQQQQPLLQNEDVPPPLPRHGTPGSFQWDDEIIAGALVACKC